MIILSYTRLQWAFWRLSQHHRTLLRHANWMVPLIPREALGDDELRRLERIERYLREWESDRK